MDWPYITAREQQDLQGGTELKSARLQKTRKAKKHLAQKRGIGDQRVRLERDLEKSKAVAGLKTVESGRN